jgi:hypothetical protein
MSKLKIEVTDEDDEVVFNSEKPTEVDDDAKDEVAAALEAAAKSLKDD